MTHARLLQPSRVSHRRSGPGAAARTGFGPAPWRASVLVILMITLLFASFALITFIEKAGNDLLVDQREAETKRLRVEAYSALEVTLAVLEDFRETDSGLHSPAEGWNDPLGFAAYAPTNDRTVEVAFEDESGKISLPHADADTLSRLFQSWGFIQDDADSMADAIQGWMHRDHIYRTVVNPDYGSGTIPYDVPGRSLRSYSELAAIDLVREKFYDTDGRPNDYWRRFVDSVSLFSFTKTNLNGAKADSLAAIGQYQQSQQQTLSDYLAGSGLYQTQGPGYFQNLTDAQNVAGKDGNTGAFTTTISALRIIITVHDGLSQFRLAAVVSPQGGGATTIQATATSTKTVTSANAPSTTTQTGPSATQNTNSNANQTSANGKSGTLPDLKYPFTLLEIRENDEIPPAPPPPPPAQS